MVRDVEVPGTVDCKFGHTVETGAGGGRAVPASATLRRANGPAAGHGRDDLCPRRYLADAQVVVVRDIEVPCTIDRHRNRSVEIGAGRGATIPAETCPCSQPSWALRAIASDGGDESGRCCHLADAVVGVLCEIDVPDTVDRDFPRLVKIGAGRGPTVPTCGCTWRTCRSIASHRRDNAGRRRYFADAVRVVVCYIQISGTIDRNSTHTVAAEGSVDRQPTIAAGSRCRSGV